MNIIKKLSRLYAFRFVVFTLSLPLFNFNIYFGCLHIQNLWMCSIYVCTLEAAGAGEWVFVCLCIFACVQHIFVISRILELRLMLFTFLGRSFYVPCTHANIAFSSCRFKVWVCIWQCRFCPFYSTPRSQSPCLTWANEWMDDGSGRVKI